MKFLRFSINVYLLFIILIQTPWVVAEADSHIELKSRLVSILAKSPENLSARQSLARLYYREKEYNHVISTLDPYSADLDKDDLNILSDSFKKKSDFKNESRVLSLALASNPEDYELIMSLAISLVRQEKLTEATNYYRKAIALKSNQEAPYLGLLDIFKKQENNYESQIIVNDLISKFGRKSNYLNELCRIFTEEAYLDQAISICKEAIQKDPKEANNFANLAQCHIDNNDSKAAESLLKQATNRFKSSDRLYTMTGNYYFNQKNYSVANRYFSRSIQINKNSHPAQLGMARSSFLLGKYDQSLTGYQSACKLDSKETIKYFKESVTKLRLDNNYQWESKFNSSLFRCN